LSAHVVMAGHPTLEEAQVVGARVKSTIRGPFRIAHATLELECEACGVPEDFCSIDSPATKQPARQHDHTHIDGDDSGGGDGHGHADHGHGSTE
jgi:hypothetical protein